MEEEIIFKFCGQKISKVRWNPDTHGGGGGASNFVSGGWDDSSNLVTWWRVPRAESRSMEEPTAVDQVQVKGSVTDMSFLSPNTFVASTSAGDTSVYSLNHKSQVINTQQTWSGIHRYDTTNEHASCTCVSTNDTEIVTGGEDGRINILQLESRKPIRTIDNADGAVINGVQYIGAREVATVNSTGQLKVWDTRRPDDQPSKVMRLSGNATPLLCVDAHPHQPHILVTGGGDGVVGVWDTRQDVAPITLISAHSAEVWEARFHPTHPDHLFTCSEDAECWFWDGSQMISEASSSRFSNQFEHRATDSAEPSSSSVWLYVDANKHRLETFSLIPGNNMAVNSFDVSSATSSMICGTDGEALVLLPNIRVK